MHPLPKKKSEARQFLLNVQEEFKTKPGSPTNNAITKDTPQRVYGAWYILLQ